MYRRFLREHPNHEEARSNMLQEMAVIAGIRTRNALQVLEQRTSGQQLFTMVGGVRTDNPDRGDPSPGQIESCRNWRRKRMSAFGGIVGRNICVIWKACFGRLVWVAVKLWGEAHSNPLGRFQPNDKSRVQKGGFHGRGSVPLRQPTSSDLWGLWITLFKTGACNPTKELLAGLQPSPLVAPAEWPPTSIRAEYLNLCRETGDRKAMQELVEPICVSMGSSRAAREVRQALRNTNIPGLVSVGDIAGFSHGFQLSNGEVYQEALLRLQKLNEVDRMMNARASGSGWPGAFLSAAAPADRLGCESPAKTWRDLGAGK